MDVDPRWRWTLPKPSTSANHVAVLRILEIACGSAVFALTFAHRDPDSVANLLDDPEGLPLARQTVESVGLDRQVVMIETEDPLDLCQHPRLARTDL